MNPKVALTKDILLNLKKHLPIVLTIVILIAVSAAVILIMWSQSSRTKTISPTPSNITKPQIKRVEVLPENLKNTPQVLKYELMGAKYTRVDANIQKIIKNGTSYLAKLDSGEEVTLSLTANTKLYDAYFDVDNNNKLVQVLYRPIIPQELDSLQVGEKVRLTYLDNNFSLKKAITIAEFVLLER